MPCLRVVCRPTLTVCVCRLHLYVHALLACRATPSSGRPFHSHLLHRCGPCKLIAPIFAALSEEISTSEAVFLKVDVDENEDTARKFEVMQMPVSTEIDEAQD